MNFGAEVRRLRTQKGLGLKRVAPELGISYGYLSKIENGETVPSEDLIQRMADFFGSDRYELMLAAGKVPEEILQLLQNNPSEAVSLLRERFGRHARARR